MYEATKAKIEHEIKELKSKYTKNVYEGALNRLLLMSPGLDWNKAEEWKVIINGLTVGESSKKSYYCAILSLKGVEEKAREVYSKRVKELSDGLYQKSKKQELTEKEKEKYLSWEDIIRLRDSIKPTSPDDYFLYQDWIILCLYTMFPPLRADYAPMLVWNKKHKKIDEGNYMVLRNKQPYMVLHEYKTKSRFGRVEIKIPEPLASYLREFREFSGNTDGEALLMNTSHAPMSAENLSQRVISIFERIANKRVGISMLRHSYITMMRSGKELTILQKEALARSMLHSALTNELYRRPEAETKSEEESI